MQSGKKGESRAGEIRAARGKITGQTEQEDVMAKENVQTRTQPGRQPRRGLPDSKCSGLVRSEGSD